MDGAKNYSYHRRSDTLCEMRFQKPLYRPRLSVKKQRISGLVISLTNIRDLGRHARLVVGRPPLFAKGTASPR